MPLRDKLDLSEDFISNNIKAALTAHEYSAWASTVPIEIFLNYILPYSRYMLLSFSLSPFS